MSALTRIDSRTFREFYPEPEGRHSAHYAFAHKFLPTYIHKNPFGFFWHLFRVDPARGVTEPTLFIHTRWTMFEELTGRIKVEGDLLHGGLRRVSDLTMSLHELANRPVALVRMPMPERPAEARFVAAALLGSTGDLETRNRDLEARVFTVESVHADMSPEVRDAGNKDVLCEWTKGGEHWNFGVGVSTESEAVLETVAGALQAPERRPVASWTPPTGAAAGTVALSGGKRLPPRASDGRKPWWKIW